MSTESFNWGTKEFEGKRNSRLVSVAPADPSDRADVEKLIAQYHSSEGLRPIKERIRWAVDQQLRGESPGLLFVAKDKDTLIGVALAVFTPSAELGRVMTVNDFFVRPAYRRRGVGRELAERLIKECKSTKWMKLGSRCFTATKLRRHFGERLGSNRLTGSCSK